MTYIIDIDFFRHGYKVSTYSGGSQFIWLVNLLQRTATCTNFSFISEYSIDVWIPVLKRCIWQENTEKLLFAISQASTLMNTKHIENIVHAQLYNEL